MAGVLDSSLDDSGITFFHVRLAVVCGLVWAADAAQLVLLSFVSPVLSCEWELSRVAEALLTTWLFVGMALGAWMFGIMADAYGRRKTYLVVVLVTLVSGLCASASPSYGVLAFMQLLVGFGLGGAHVAFTLFSEYLPGSWRAKSLVGLAAFFSFGGVLEVFLAWALLDSGWRSLMLASASTMVVPLCLFPWVPESARWLFSQGREEEAHEELERMAQAGGVAFRRRRTETWMSEPGAFTVAERRMSVGSDDTARLTLSEPGELALMEWIAEAPREGDERDRRRRREEEGGGGVGVLWSPELKGTVMRLVGVWAAAAFGYYGLVLGVTELFAAEDAGERCSRRLGENGCVTLSQEDYVDVLLTTLAEFPGLILVGVVIDRSRTKTIAGTFGVAAAAILALVICSGRTVETGLLLVARAMLVGAFQAAFVYTPEALPTNARGVGVGVCSAAARVGGMLTPHVAEALLRTNSALALSVYALSCAGAAVAAGTLPIDTAGKPMPHTMEDIRRLQANDYATIPAQEPDLSHPNNTTSINDDDDDDDPDPSPAIELSTLRPPVAVPPGHRAVWIVYGDRHRPDPIFVPLRDIEREREAFREENQHETTPQEAERRSIEIANDTARALRNRDNSTATQLAAKAIALQLEASRLRLIGAHAKANKMTKI